MHAPRRALLAAAAAALPVIARLRRCGAVTDRHTTTTAHTLPRRGYRRRAQDNNNNDNTGSSNSSSNATPLLQRLRRHATSDVVVLAAVLMLLSVLWDELRARGGVVRQRLKDLCTTTLEVRSSHEQYAMIMDWMARQPRMRTLRNLALRPVTILDEAAAAAASGSCSGSGSNDATTTASDGGRALLVPGYGSHVFRFGTTWLCITRSEDTSKQSSSSSMRGGGGGGGAYHVLDREHDVLTVTLLTRRRDVLQAWLASVQASWQAHVQSSVRVYLGDAYGARWRLLTERARRPLSTLQLPADTLAVAREAAAFLRLRATYAALGVPWRRGYLFEGSPGTGKTSFALALASELHLPVYLLSLHAADMDDDALLSLISAVPPRALLLIEDLENALRTCGDGGGGNSSVAAAATPTSNAAHSAARGVSLSALLNALDGVASSEGRLLVVTTNDVARLPSPAALLRPGRIDRCVHFAPLRPAEMAAMRASFAARLRTHLATTAAGDADAALQRATAADGAATTTPSISPAAYQQTLLDAVLALATRRDDDAARTLQ